MRLIVKMITSLLSIVEKMLFYNNADNSYKQRRDFLIKREY